jgi:hypothetical protein
VNTTRFYAGCFVLSLGIFGALPEPGQAATAEPVPSIYATPSDPAYTPEASVGNTGGVNLDLTFRYLTDYVYRGVDHNELGGKEDAPNAQFDGALSFDLGKAPHPYLGVFMNIYNDDPISRFQEVRPYFGADWTIRPLTIEAGHNTYLLPEREHQNSAEFYVRFTLDDSYWFKTENPVFSPYIYGAYDYDRYEGWYFETGIQHVFVVPDTGLDIRTYADVAYVTTNQLYATTLGGEDSGFQHYDLGVTIRYNLNNATMLPSRYGTWSVEGYVIYTDGISRDLRADTQLWGGMGLRFRY